MDKRNTNYINILKNPEHIEDIDLENVDLSEIPEIKNLLIAYANLHNTNLKFLFTDYHMTVRFKRYVSKKGT